MMNVVIKRLVAGHAEWDEALAFRRALLRTPLGLDFSAADLATESADILFAAYRGARLAGVVMLRLDGADSVKLRQMAVAEDLRGQHVGEKLIEAFETHARDLGRLHVGLAARKTATGFYERQGYVVDSGEFIEVTIPHFHMSKSLAPAS